MAKTAAKTRVEHLGMRESAEGHGKVNEALEV